MEISQNNKKPSNKNYALFKKITLVLLHFIFTTLQQVEVLTQNHLFIIDPIEPQTKALPGLGALTFEDPANNNYKFLYQSDDYINGKTMYYLVLYKLNRALDPQTQKYNFTSATFLKTLESPKYKQFNSLGNFLLYVDTKINYWNVETDQFYEWNIPGWTDLTEISKVSLIANSSRFIAGGKISSDFITYLLDINELSFFNKFRSGPHFGSVNPLMTPTNRDPFLLQVQFIQDTQKFSMWVYDYTKAYSYNEVTNVLSSQTNLTGCANPVMTFSDVEDDKNFWYTCTFFNSKIYGFKWGQTSPFQVEYYYDLKESDFGITGLEGTYYDKVQIKQLVVIPKTSYIVVIKSNPTQGEQKKRKYFVLFDSKNYGKFLRIDNPNGNRANPPTTTTALTGLALPFFFRNLKISGLITNYQDASNVHHYEILIDQHSSSYFPCFDSFSVPMTGCDELDPNIATDCITIAHIRPNGTNCTCIQGWKNTGTNICELCKSPAYECDSFGNSKNIRCEAGYYLDDSGTCQNCSLAEGKPTGCSTAVVFGFNGIEVDSVEKKFEILLNIDLTYKGEEETGGGRRMLGNEEIDPKSFLAIMKETKFIGNESLNSKFNVTYDRINNNTRISVEILDDISEKMNSKVGVITQPGFIYKAAITPGSYVIITKKQASSLQVVNQASRKIKNPAKITLTYIWIIIIASLVSGILSKFGLSSFIFLIKYFQILDIINNFGKINLKYSMTIRMAIEFIDELRFPKIKFIENMSPIKDKKSDEFRDIYDYLKYRRGKRGKITSSNQDIFLFQGSNFFYSLVMISTFLPVEILSWFNIKNKFLNFANKIFNWVHFFFLGMFFFDIQFLTVNEVGIHNISKNQPAKYKWSYIMSSLILIMTLYYCSISYSFLKKINQKKTKQKKKSDNRAEIIEVKTELELKNSLKEKFQLKLEEEEKTGPYLIMRFFTEELNEEAIEQGSLAVLFDNYRFFLIQIMTSGFQLFKLPQAILIFSLNSVYFSFYLASFSKLKNRKIIYEGNLTTIKCFTKEICIELFLSVMVVTSFFIKLEINYENSRIYELTEFVAVGSIGIAVLGEFLMLFIPIKNFIIFLYIKFLRKKYHKGNNKIYSKDILTEREKINNNNGREILDEGKIEKKKDDEFRKDKRERRDKDRKMKVKKKIGDKKNIKKNEKIEEKNKKSKSKIRRKVAGIDKK